MVSDQFFAQILRRKQFGGVVVDDAGGLHPGVDDGGADEFEAAPLEFF